MTNLFKTILFSLALPAATAGTWADTTTRDYYLNISVVAPIEKPLNGTSFNLHHNGFDVDYSSTETKLDKDGKCSIKVYGGNHTFALNVAGCKPYTSTFDVDGDVNLTVNLLEDIYDPYSFKSELIHDVYTGKNDVRLSWNTEEAVFFDNFESYTPFTIDPAPWTGIDGDKYPTVALTGSYPNAGKLQYITIVNPSAVNPAWDLQYYYTLAPYSGNQYAAFVQNTAGDNNDWFISPAITVGDDNVLRFYARSADAEPARLKVGITTEMNPAAADFVTISEGNFLTPDYSEWAEIRIPLDKYAGQTVKIGFYCSSRQGTMMTMIDDVFVGRINDFNQTGKARCVAQRSPANPNEKFIISKNGTQIAETTDYCYTVTDIADGNYTFGVQAVLVTGSSNTVTTTINVDSGVYAAASFNVATNNGLSPEGYEVAVSDAHHRYSCNVAGGKASIPSLPKGDYNVAMSVDGFDPVDLRLPLTENKSLDITLAETIVKPFNIVADILDNNDGTCNLAVSWNRDLGFTDGFESYADFATGNFGDWITYNFNGEHQFSYPISYNGQIVQYPGCATSDAPRSVPPIVFNPDKTRPALTSDGGFTAPEGSKYVAFMSPQMTYSDKWLISPKMKIYEGYEFAFTGKSYGGYYETLQLCISESGGEQPEDFVVLDEVVMPYDTWTRYYVDLAEYAGKEIRVAIRDVTYDGFVAQVDDVAIAPAEDSILHTGSGFVNTYDVSLDGTAAANVDKPEVLLTNVAHGTHIIGVTANFVTGTSEEALYEIRTNGIGNVETELLSKVSSANGVITIELGKAAPVAVADVAGKTIFSDNCKEGTITIPAAPGIYIISIGTRALKLVVR